MSKPEVKPELIKATTAATVLDISVMTFYRWQKEYKDNFPKAARIGSKTIRYRYDDVVNFGRWLHEQGTNS